MEENPRSKVDNDHELADSDEPTILLVVVVGILLDTQRCCAAPEKIREHSNGSVFWKETTLWKGLETTPIRLVAADNKEFI
jgi:hypothetical protein